MLLCMVWIYRCLHNYFSSPSEMKTVCVYWIKVLEVFISTTNNCYFKGKCSAKVNITITYTICHYFYNHLFLFYAIPKQARQSHPYPCFNIHFFHMYMMWLALNNVWFIKDHINQIFIAWMLTSFVRFYLCN